MKRVLFFIFLTLPLFSFAKKVLNVDSIQNIISVAKEDSVVVKAYLELGNYFTPVDVDSSYHYYKLAYEKAIRAELPLYIAKSEEKLGVCNYHKGDFNDAIELYEKANKIYLNIDNLLGLSSTYNNIGIAYARLGQLDKACDYLFKATEIDLKLGNKSDISVGYVNLGILSTKIGNDKKALEYYEKAFVILQEIDDKYGMPGCLNSMAALNYKNRDYELALKQYNEGLELAIEYDRIAVPSFNSSIGATYEAMGDFTTALEYFYIARDIYLERGNKHGLSEVYAHMSSNYLNNKQYDKSIEFALKCNDVAKTIESLPTQQMAHEYLSLAYFGLANYKKAFEMQSEYMSLKDSIYTENSASQINEMEAKYENQRKQDENEIENIRMKKEKLYDKAIIKKQKTITLLFLLALIIAISLVIFIYRLSKITKQKNTQLQELNHTKDKFFSIVAHDLRSPFQSLLGFTEVLTGGHQNLTEIQRQEIYTNLNATANNTFNLLTNLFEWAKTQRGAIQFNPSPFKLGECINDIVLLLKHRASEKNINFSGIVDADLTINSDRQMLQTVIFNLTNNALKFTPVNGTVSIQVKQFDNSVKICVIDTGIGIPPSEQKQMFKIESKFQRNGTNGELGTGLGLILCAEFTHLMNGEIEVNSIPNKGSKFCITIPMKA